jgi:hypothetical protein
MKTKKIISIIILMMLILSNNVMAKQTPLKLKFEDSILFGDSISLEASQYNYLNDCQVIAKKGANIQYAISNLLPKLKNTSPANIVVLFGYNDIHEGLNPNTYAKSYYYLLNKIKKTCPYSKILVVEELPAYNSRIPNLNQYNLAVEKMCKQYKFKFINTENLNYYAKVYREQDGIHFTSSFYKYYLDYISKFL